MSSPEALCAYEQERNENIARNRAFLESIGLAQPRAPPAPAAPAAPAGAAAPADAACDVDAVLAALGRAWPGRRRELAALAAALLAPGDGPVVVAGPPGGGKTSFVLALAGDLGLDVCLLSLSDEGLTDDRLALALAHVPPRCAVLLEDARGGVLPRRARGAAPSNFETRSTPRSWTARRAAAA